MKAVIAPDSFKESMSALEASQAIQSGIKAYDSSLETVLCPLADGGEGTLETLVNAMGGSIESYEVTGPLFQSVCAPIGYVEDKAIIECAKVCGLEMLNEDEKNPEHTTTYGLGELIKHALDHGTTKLLICLGGSATNDGGIGMLNAMGVKFMSDQGSVSLTMSGLSQITDVDFSSLDQRLMNVEVIGVCDVKNPLCGRNGATYIYGPQKGLRQNELEKTDQAMQHYATLMKKYLKQDYASFPGAGAAGGLGFALLICHAHLQSGFDVVAKIQKLEEKIKSSDFVVVGEGKMDKQTQFGKTPYGVLKLAKTYKKPVFAFAGRVEDCEVLKSLGFLHVYEISPRHIELSIALMSGQEFLKESVYQHMEDMINGI